MVKIKIKMTATELENRVIACAINLLTKGPTTTLDIKIACRSAYPNDKFYQSDVSDVMDKIAPNRIKGLTYNDTGQYRVYYITLSSQPPIVQTSVISVSKKDMVKLLRANTGKFFGITFTKKDGTKRTLNGQMSDKKFINDLGYLNIITNKGDYKQVDPKKILEVTINGNKYITN